ncbi:MAG: 50S ribosomal protein L6 [Treponema sp.]|jgi:large subunit ribosomal protein L6|nr:50S ribosomal protein L6 [Treponema sp.]
MSRVGKIPVAIPAGVKVAVKPCLVEVEGPKGKLSEVYNDRVKIEVTGSELVVTPANETKEANAAQGLYRNLIHNMVVGVSSGFSKSLVINGVGYRAEVQGKLLVLSLGYSSDYVAVIPDGLAVASDNQGKLTVSGSSKQQVGEFCAQIRKLRKPEPYKGKGIRYETETIKRKVGKSGVK